MVLVDTDVLIECLRGSVTARNWLQGAPKETFGIPGVVAMELLMGCRNQPDLQQTRKFLSTFTVVGPRHLNSRGVRASGDPSLGVRARHSGLPDRGYGSRTRSPLVHIQPETLQDHFRIGRSATLPPHLAFPLQIRCKWDMEIGRIWWQLVGVVPSKKCSGPKHWLRLATRRTL